MIVVINSKTLQLFSHQLYLEAAHLGEELVVKRIHRLDGSKVCQFQPSSDRSFQVSFPFPFPFAQVIFQLVKSIYQAFSGMPACKKSSAFSKIKRKNWATAMILDLVSPDSFCRYRRLDTSCI